ncbi:MAG: ROK family protein, partial [Candidatus Eisenbacteria bacterium]|nr:ROK family protein [Candidatus Eisenbacteria bacterium]
MPILGIDVGGTKTAVCAGTEEGKILASQRMTTPGVEKIDAYFDDLFALCGTVLDDAHLILPDIDAVGISAPGPLDARRGMLLAPPNNPGWIDIPIVERIRARCPCPIFINNDANAAVLAEREFGTFRGCANMIYLTCSTGMGAGIVAAGRLVQGVTDMGGEVGHHTVVPQGLPCPCGRRGCWEVYVGGRNVGVRLQEKIAAGGIRTTILDFAGGKLENVGHRALVRAARAGDPFALAEWNDFLERLAQGIGNLIMILNPEVVLLGTMAIHEGDFLLDPLRERVADYTWEWPWRACRIEAATLGTRIGDLASIAVAK